MANFLEHNFFHDTRGNMSIIAGVVGVMLLTAVGASLDGGQMISTKQRLQSITDAAALMAATPEGVSAAKRKKLAESSIQSHVARVGGIDISSTTINVNEADGQVYVALSANVPLLFGGVLGSDLRRVSTSSTAEGSSSASASALSISLVLDLSSSMQDRFDRGSKIASVHAAVSDVLNMVATNFGGDAAAATQVSTGVYPFNWGMVDGETVALRPGTNDVLDAMTYLSLSEGSVPSSAMEQAVEDQLAEAKENGERDRYIVYVTDGRVDHDKSDVSDHYLDEKMMFSKDANLMECVHESKRIMRADVELEPNLVELASPIGRLSPRELLTPWNVNRALYMSPGCKNPSHPHHPSQFSNAASAYDPNVDKKMNERITKDKHLGHAHSRDVLEIKAKRLEVREKFLKTCQPIQTVRVVEACEKAREEGISIIAINLSGEDGLASNISHMCANGFEFGDAKKHAKAGAETEIDSTVPMEISTRKLSTGLKIRVSSDGQSVSGDVNNLTELREMLGSMLPAGTKERHVRLID